MKLSTFLFIFLFLTNFEVFCQSRQESNNFIKIITPLKYNTYAIKELTKDSLLIYTGKLGSINPETRQGKFYFYEKNGKVSAVGQYNQDIPIGLWVYYNELGDTLYKIDYSKVLDYLSNEAMNYTVDSLAISKFNKQDKKYMNKDGTFLIVEEMPVFNNDETGKDFNNYIKQNLKYPVYAEKKGIEGTVYINCFIDTNGKIKNPTIIRPAYPDLNIEAIRIISESPVWKPGFQKKIPVIVGYTIPVRFKLSKK